MAKVEFIQIATEEEIKEKLAQFNNIDLDDDDAVDEYLEELQSYIGSAVITEEMMNKIFK